mgnify:CR=1 FL=1
MENFNKMRDFSGFPTHLSPAIFKAVSLISLVLLIIMIIWLRTIIKKIKMINGEEPKCAGELLLCLFLPFYYYYWIFTRARKLSEAAENYKVHIKDNSALYLIMTIFMLGFFAMIALHINCNKAIKVIAQAQRSNQGKVPEMLNSEINKTPAPVRNKNLQEQRVRTPMDDLIGLAKLKVEGKITLDEYEKRREDVLTRM